MNKSLLTLALIWLTSAAISQTDILDARTNYNIDDVVTITGIVINDEGLGTVRYIQDTSAGIAIYPGGSWDGFTEPLPGDEITVTGPITEFNGLLEVGPGLTTVTINSTGNALPEPQEITPNMVNESVEGELIRVNVAQFVTGGIEIQGNATYDYNASGEPGVVYFRTGNPLVGAILPAGQLDIIGIGSQFSFDGFGGYQLLPRNADDLVQTSSINLASEVKQENITTTSFDLEWTTDAAGNSIVDYGLTPALGTMISADEMVQDHMMALEGLEPGTIYYAQISSELGEDVTTSGLQAFATKSLSSGEIKVYFNNAVDTEVATIEEAVSLGANMNDTIAAYIDKAMISLDVAIYNVSDNLIISAINDALDREVQVRYIAEGSNLNIGLATLNDDIPVLERTDGEGSGMHNKFVIIDAVDTDNAYVLGGSTNWTEPNLSSDYNNLIILQDESLAKGYTLEFEEMWGSDGPMPDEGNAKFGTDKTKNTPVKYIVGESAVEAYFSPTDNTTSAIVNALLTSEYDLDFAVLSFTRDELRDAVIDVNSSFFITARGMIEQTDETSEYDELLEAGVAVFSHQGIQYQVHHKLAIIDHSQPEADPIVVTGSHNWSSSAENINDENTLIVHDARVANLYFQEWWELYSSFLGVDELGNEIKWMVYPNPTTDFIRIDLSNQTNLIGALVVTDTQGRELERVTLNGSPRYEIALTNFSSGSYQVSIVTPDWSNSKTVVKY